MAWLGSTRAAGFEGRLLCFSHDKLLVAALKYESRADRLKKVQTWNSALFRRYSAAIPPLFRVFRTLAHPNHNQVKK